jgi:hypothetical protein
VQVSFGPQHHAQCSRLSSSATWLRHTLYRLNLAILLKASDPPLLSLRTVIVDPCFSSILTAHRVDLQSSLAAHSTAEPTSTGMHWLAPNDNGVIKLDSLQLDIVGFLAILGEGSVLANAQVSTLSKWIFLPRLIPAPQALMRPTRPLVLEPVPGSVSGIFSGNFRDNINHIGNIVW